jgi:PAS domain S-box-containing protein
MPIALFIDREKAITRHYLALAMDTPLLDAMARMQHEGLDCVLVMRDDRLAGLFTERDALRLLAEGRMAAEMTLDVAMTVAPITIPSTQAADPALLLTYFRRHAIRHLPVLDEAAQVLGVITAGSLLAGLQPAVRQPAARTPGDDNALLKAVFDDSTDALFLVDPNTLLTVDCNQRAVALFEADDKAELLGIAGHTLQRYPCPEDGWNAFGAALRAAGEWSMEAEYRTRKGRYFLGHVAAKPIHIGGRVIHLVRLADVSARKAMETALRESEERLRLILEFGRIGIWDWRINTQQLIWNDAHYRLLGYAPGAVEPSYHLWRARVHPVDIERVEEDLLRSLETHSTFEGEYRVVHPDGTLRRVYSEGHGIYDESGLATRVIGLITDITERRRAEEALRQNQERLQLIADSLPVCISLVDGEYRYQFVNRTYQIWFGVPPGDIVGRSVGEFHGETAFQTVKKYLDRGLAGEAVTYEIELPSVRGPGRYISTTVVPAWEGHAQPIGVYVLTTDLSERKRSELALQQSETRLRQAQRIAGVGNWELDVATRRITGSDQLFRLFDFDPGRPEPALAEYVTRLHPDDRVPLQQCIAQAMSEGTSYQIDLRIPRDHGALGYLEARGQALRDRHGRITRLFGTVLDITERKQAEGAARRTQRFLDSIIENLPAMVFVKDARTLRFVQFNKAGETLLGIAREELLGKSDYDFFPKEEADFFIAKDREVLAGGELIDIPEEPIQTRRQGIRVLHTRKIPLLDEAGNPQYLLGISQDITARKQVETELRQAKEVAEAANRSKSEFLATMSHEIRTPMNAVIGMTSLLLDTPLTAEQQHWVGTIRRGGEALLAVINDILDFSRIESGQLQLDAQPFALQECIDDVVDLLANRAGEKGLWLAARMDVSVPAVIVGDAGRLRQILVNLVGNAIKFTDTGRIGINVSAAPLAAGNQDAEQEVVFTVQDTGIGIPEERLPRLFQPFSQVDSSITRKYGGTGLGLAICQRLCALMGGEIGVTSEIGQGSLFRFTIRGRVVRTPEEPPSARVYAPRWDAQLARRLPLQVLVAEDNPINQQVIQMMLQRLGYTPDLVANGQEVVTALRQRAYDLILMDVQMPEMDGLTATRQVRGQFSRQPWIIGLSANAFAEDQEVALAAGMDDYLVKPLKMEDLVWVLQQVPCARSSPS